MTRARRFGALVTAGGLMLGLSACTSSSAGRPANPDRLSATMDSVSGSGPASVYLEYADLSRLRALGVLSADPFKNRSARSLDPRWQGVIGLGGGAFSANAQLISTATAIDMYQADSAVTIGNPPDTATRFTGPVDAKSIKDKLTGLGAKARTFGSTSGLSFGADNSIDASGALTQRTGLVNQLDQVVVTGQEIAASPNSTSVQKVLGGDPSLLATGQYRSIASCLGDVVAAIILTPAHQQHSAVVAVGIRNPTPAAPQHEVLCLLPTTGQQATVHAAVTSRLAPAANDPLTDGPLSTYLGATTVTDVGPLVRAVLTLQTKTPVGYLISGVQRNLPAYWDGTCTAQSLGQHRC